MSDGPLLPRARGTRDWVKADYPLGTNWMIVYSMYCLGTCLTVCGALELAYRLGRADTELLNIRKPKPSKIYG